MSRPTTAPHPSPCVQEPLSEHFRHLTKEPMSPADEVTEGTREPRATDALGATVRSWANYYVYRLEPDDTSCPDASGGAS